MVGNSHTLGEESPWVWVVGWVVGAVPAVRTVGRRDVKCTQSQTVLKDRR